MTLYEITGHYPTEGPDAYVWGEPEERLEAVLAEQNVEIFAMDMGTLLATGDRDVSMEVDATSIDTLNKALAALPSSERTLWKIEELT